MLFVIDKARLQRLIAVTRDDRTPRDKGKEGPFYRIQAFDNTLRLTGRAVEATVPATVHVPGVMFLRVTLFRQMLRMVPASGFIAIQAHRDGLTFADVTLAASNVDMLLYPDVASAPELHPTERKPVPPPPNPDFPRSLFDHLPE